MERAPSNDGSIQGTGSANGSGSSSRGGVGGMISAGEMEYRGVSPSLADSSLPSSSDPSRQARSYSPSRPPTSAEIDAVIAAAMANAPPHMLAPPEPVEEGFVHRSGTPLMTNLLPSAVGMDGRVNLFVGNLPYRVRWQDLKDLFRKAGTVLRADVSLGPDNRSRGYGTVLLGSREDAARAIDRFNGYTWQTRTLEVRPDRLPPEYEAQPHPLHIPNQNQNGPPNNGQLSNANFGNGRAPPMYPFNNGPPAPPGSHSYIHPQQNSQPPYPLSNGNSGNGGPPWNGPGIHPQRLQGMYGNSVGNSHGGSTGGNSPHPPPQGLAPSPVPGAPSPPLSTTGAPNPTPIVRDPVAGLNITPSPLAGALSGPTIPNAPLVPQFAGERRGSLAPYSNNSMSSHSPDIVPPPFRGSTPGISSSSSRPTSAAAGPFEGGRRDQRASFSGSEVSAPPHFPVHIDGLAHQGMGLGPPSNLHDRVVFVSNMPLNMQWQDLKDLLRPAGLIMRADVAQDDNRKPRGYGTALFATETDAARAVNMFNGKEIGGRHIRVNLERQIRNMQHPPSQGQHQASYESAQFRQMQMQDNSQSSVPSSPAPPPRVPWGLNTSVNQTPQRPSSTSSFRGPDSTPGPNGSGMETLSSPAGFPGGPTPGPNFRATHIHHPGPISMPPFSPSSMGMGTPGPDGNPLSPLQMRNLPPMTPSMPGFVFNAFMPETPSIHGWNGHNQNQPHHFLSPGAVGPFSPGIPMNSPGGFGWGAFMNSAPGGPVDRSGGFGTPGGNSGGYLGGSAALGTPTTTSFAPGDHPIHGYGGSAPGGPANGGMGSPGTTPNGHSYSGGGGGEAQGNGNGEYFPIVPRPVGQDTTRTRFSNQANGSGEGVRLNARDRLASTSETNPTGSNGGESKDSEGISNLVSRLTMSESQGDLGGNGGESEMTPPGGGSPTIDHLEKRRHAAAGLGKMNISEEEKVGDTRGRYSLDGDRPPLGVLLGGAGGSGGGGLKVGGNLENGLGERRASFGDLEKR